MSLEGKLADLGLPDIFQILSLSKRSGILTILRKEGTARLVFSHGQIVYASSDNNSRLGYTLVSKGIITTEELEEALKIQSRHKCIKPLGTVLIEMELITKEVLEEEIKKHICVVVSELLTWTSGAFHFELGELIERDGVNVPLKGGIDTDFILLESARIRDEKAAFKDRANMEGTQSDNRFRDSTGKPESIQNRTDPGEPDDMKILTSMIAEISGPSSRSEITLMVLRFASELMNRAVIFLVRKNDVVGLGQFGVALDGSTETDLRIRNVTISLTGESVFKYVVEKKETFRGELGKSEINKLITKHLGGEWPCEVFVAPLIADDRVVAVLYGDNLPEKKKIGRTDGIEAFIRVAGVSLGKTLLERKLRERQMSPGSGPVNTP